MKNHRDLSTRHHQQLGGTSTLDQGRLKDAEMTFNRALVGNEKAWEPEHRSTLDTVNNLETSTLIKTAS